MGITKYNREIVILVAEDNDEIRENLVGPLKNIYNVVYEASNGQEAIDIIEVEQIDIIITDINMPVMCGNDLIDYLTNRDLPFIPVIITSAHHRLSREYKGLKCIAINDKPYNVIEIIDRIEQMYKIDTEEKKQCSYNVASNKIRTATRVAKQLLNLVQSMHKTTMSLQ